MRRFVPALALAGLAAIVVADPPGWAERVPGEFLGVMTWQWIAMAAVSVLGAALYEIARLIVRKVLRLRSKGSVQPSERSLGRGAGVLAFLVPWYFMLESVGLSREAEWRVRLGLEALTIVGVVLLVYGLWDAVCDSVAHRASGVANAEKLLIPVTRKLVRFMILLAGVLLALGVFGVNIAGLLAGVGIGGLVVALAAKDSVENVFGSLTILFDMPFALGDWVKIDKFEGIVEEINLRSTRIRTFEDSIITLPNSNLIKAAVENYGARRYRRQRFQVRVSYANSASNLERFMSAVRKYLAGVSQVVPDRTIVELNDMTEASAGVLVQCFFEAESFRDEAKLRGALMLAIFRAQEESNVVFVGAPIPQPEPPPISKQMQKLILEKEDII